MNPRNRPVPPIHLDERWNCLERKDAHQSAPDGASLPQRVHGRPWRGSSSAPALRLMVAAFVGPRTYDRAMTVLPMPATVVSGNPWLFSAGFRRTLAARGAV